MNPNESISAQFALPILIGVALLIQLFGRYQAHNFAIGHFYYSWFPLRMIIPLILIRAIRIPHSKLGLGPPHIRSIFQNPLIHLGVEIVFILSF